MSPQLLSAILWIPFGIVALIAGLINCISGYKKGVWHALGKLGAVVLSTVASVALARLIAGAGAPAIAAALPVEEVGQISGAALQVVLSGIVSAAVAMVLFCILMLILTPVFGVVISLLLGKQLVTDRASLKWLGLATGVVTTLVFTFCWLSPLYGTLATVAPVAQSVMNMEQEQDAQSAQATAYIQGVSNHLLVQASGAGPVNVVYDQLSRMSVGGSTVSVVQMTEALNETLGLVAQIQETRDPALLTQLSTQAVELTKTAFVEQDWFYTLFRELTAELKMMAAVSTQENADYYRSMLELADMPQEEFRQTMTSVLDFALFALEKDVFTMAENLSVTQIYQSGIIQEMGKVFNSTDRIVELKKLTMAVMLEEDGLTYEQALALLEKYQVGKLTEEKDQVREVEALLVPGLMPDVPAALMILRHPSLGGSALMDVQEMVGFAKLMGLSEEVAAKWSAEKQNALIISMMSLAKMSFEDLANAGLNLDDMAGGNAEKNEQTQTTPDSSETPDEDVTVEIDKNNKPSEDSGLSEDEKKDKIKDKIDEVGVSGAKDALDKMDEDEKQDIKDTLDKMGVDNLEDAKDLVDKMDVKDIVDIMENMGYGDLADKMGLK